MTVVIVVNCIFLRLSGSLEGNRNGDGGGKRAEKTYGKGDR